MNDKDFQPGYFDTDTGEYVLRDPRTPMPWMHYLFNDEYCALLSVTGGGYSFHQSAKSKRILRMRPNNVPFDRPGRYVYIKNNKTGDFHSAGWAPVMKNLSDQTYSCRIGAGFLSIESCYNKIQTKLAYFVPRGDNLEVWRVSIKNQGAEKLDLSVYPYAEFALYDAVNDRDNYQYMYNIAHCSGNGNFIFNETQFPLNRFLVFFWSSAFVESYDCDREVFIGPYNSEANPSGLFTKTLANKNASGGNPCAAQKIPLSLDAGAEREIVFLLGVAGSRQEAADIAAKYSAPGYPDQKLDEVKKYWAGIFARLEIATPDSDLTIVSKLFHPYQIHTTLRMSRGPSIYEGGINRGIGYRDSNQDSLGPAYQAPDKVEKLIAELASFQYKGGHAAHGYFPHTREGYGDKYSDDHLWLMFSVVNYIKETGDTGILDVRRTYIDSATDETIFDHLKRALDFTANNLGSHGLPLMFQADWNDCLQLSGPKMQGESVWTGLQFHKALIDFVELCEATNRKQEIVRYTAIAASIKKNVYKHAWNGTWFYRGFDDDGNPVGSEKNDYAKVFLNAQSWAVYSQVAEESDALTAMDIVKEKLDSKYGIALLWPAFKEYESGIGAITAYPPGLKENGGIFCHANTWAIIAECMLGRGDRAYEYYKKLLPTEYNRRARLHRAEPYIYSQVIAGPEHPDFGLARNSWLTGTASWMHIALMQYILGIKPGYSGLIIDPCIPKAWNGYSVKRQIRSAMYSIEVSNPDHVNSGVRQLVVNGKEIEGNTIDYVQSGEVAVKAILGK